MNYARKKDATHDAIITALRGVGAAVKETYQFPGMLDMIVGFRGRTFWADAKTDSGKLTRTEEDLMAEFARVGVTLHIWRTPDEALLTIGVLEESK